MTFYESYANWDKDREDLDRTPSLKATLEELDKEEGEYVMSTRDITTEFEKDISYQANFDWSELRCLDVITYHVRVGHHAEYLEHRQMTRRAHEKGHIDEHLIIYQMASGVPGPIYFVLRPLKSLHTIDVLDEAHKTGEVFDSEDDHKKAVALFAASADSEEEEYFCADPQMSYVTSAWAGSNKDFWLNPSKAAQGVSRKKER